MFKRRPLRRSVDQLLALRNTVFFHQLLLTLFSCPLTVCRVFTERAVGDNIHEEGLERNCFGAKKWGLSSLQYYHIVQSKN
jgi:hypothetical protein